MRKNIINCISILFFFALLLTVNVIAYADTKPVTAQIPVRCNAQNSTEKFVFQLTPDSTEHQKIESRTLSLSDSGNGTFTVEYDYPGTYKYKVEQLPGSEDNTSYDSTVYNANVYVTEDNDGVMHTETIVFIGSDSDKKDACNFTNIVSAKQTEPIVDGESDVPDAKSWSEFVEAVKTGDVSGLSMYIAIVGLCLLSFIAVVWKKAKKSE